MVMRRRFRAFSFRAATGAALVLLTCVALTGCAGAPTSATREVEYGEQAGEEGKAVTQVELQEELQRFSSLFVERGAQEIQKMLGNASPELSQTLLRQALLYFSSAMSIATGPTPEVNLMDMLTFMTLSREVLESYWLPEVYGDRGKELLEAFRKSEQDIWRLADKVSTRAQQQLLRDLIEQWRQENPDQIRVEWVRLRDFSRKAGRVEQERAEEVGGLLAGVEGAVSAADQAVLLGNRALYLAQRLPFLFRLQARLAALEVTSDLLSQTAEAEELLTDLKGASPLVGNLITLAEEVGEASGRFENMITVFREKIPFEPQSTLGDKLNALDRIAANLVRATDQLSRVEVEKAAELMVTARHEVDLLILKFALATLLVGGGLVGIWWGGHYLANKGSS